MTVYADFTTAFENSRFSKPKTKTFIKLFFFFVALTMFINVIFKI